MKSLRQYLPYLALTTAAIIWGANIPLMKYTLSFIPVFSLAFFRFFFGSLLLLILVHKDLRFERNDWFHLFLSGFLGLTVHISLHFFGLSMTSALNAGIITGILPIILMIFAAIFMQEKITTRMKIGAVVAFVGLSIIFVKDLFTQGLSISPIGDMAIFISSISFAAYVTLSKELTKKYKPLALTFYVFFIGSIFFIPGVIYEYLANPTWYQHVPLQAFGGLFYGMVFAALIGFSLWEYGIAHVSEAKLGFFLYITPVVCSIISVFLLGDTLTEEFLIGALLICIGLLISQAHIHHKKALHH